MKNRFFLCALFLLFGTTTFAQKNRISLGYHSAYIIERGTFSKLGLQLSLERQLSSRWSILGEYAFDDYCRCDLEPYTFQRKDLTTALDYNMWKTSPNKFVPSTGRFMHGMLLAAYHWKLGKNSNQSLSLGSGLLWRKGGEMYLIAITWEGVVSYRRNSDWAIPIRLGYHYNPPNRWWGITGYLQYQGYFHYAKNWTGNAPMNVLHTGINFDFRWGKREQMKREK